jgi:hypothetical protein
MYAVWLDSETTAVDVAWQMRAWRIRNVIFICAEDYLAFRLALALSKGKVLYYIDFIQSVLTFFLLLLICANIIIHFLPNTVQNYNWVQSLYSVLIRHIY